MRSRSRLKIVNLFPDRLSCRLDSISNIYVNYTSQIARDFNSSFVKQYDPAIAPEGTKPGCAPPTRRYVDASSH